MTNDFLKFDVPQLYNPYDRDEILCNLEALAISASCMAGDGSMIAHELAEIEVFDGEYDPERTYMDSYDGLIELVGGYNYFIGENGLSEPLIQLVVDEGKTSLLENGSRHPVYKVVLCSDSQ
jgi:hypothetical protein